MTILLRTAFLTTSLISLVIALPMKAAPEVAQSDQDSDVVYFYQAKGPRISSSDEIKVGQCLPVTSELPLTVHINNIGSYRLTSFSSDNCDDNTVLSDTSIERNNSIHINERKPICSFKLGKTPWPSSPVKVSFSFEGPAQKSFNGIQNLDCHDICNESWGSKFAKSVEIQLINGEIANNYIELFSDRSCQYNTLIQHTDGSSIIQNAEDLVKLTLRQKKTAKSFLVTRLK